ncbi:unnamed protein product [Acanthocheilonema viteae]|uniref:Uncharacterized protein n=1 Tax=Acanthocheilonema viteae TaxID=6277 RepID=A0A498SNT2_ACAVI|nr:unnamed protein product [Acanthocheilonema viteae]
MDETDNIVIEDNCPIGENDDNEVVYPKQKVTQRSAIYEHGFETEGGYSIREGNTSKVKHEESDFPESALTTKHHGEVFVERTCSHFEISKDENFGADEFDATGEDIQENQCSDESNAENVIELKQSSSEISQNKVVEATHDGPETAEIRSVYNAGKSHSQGPKHYIPPGWVYHGESDGHRYYIGCAGEMYSVDRDGYWYMQDSSGNFIPYNGYQYNRGAHSSLFPRDSQGRFILPTNARGEKAFPVDTNNMPIFPFDTMTHLPTFPVDENGQPVFPTSALGRPIVPVDTNGLAIFPRDANGRFIFPSGPNGKPTAPVNIYGIPVMPLDEQGKPVVPYDASGIPLIHLASDGSFVIRVSVFFIMKDFSLFLAFSVYGITPLTEEEYQYSLQWNYYYSRYYKNTAEQAFTIGTVGNESFSNLTLPNRCCSSTSKISGSSQSVAQLTTTDDTYEQKAKNMKLLKKVRPEDIDLPPCVPPPPSTQPSALVSDGSALSEVEKKTPDPALKAKTKKMIEMQLKFSRKKLRDAINSSVAVLPSSEIMNTSVEHAPQQPSDSPENIDKIESPKECPPPPPIHVPTPDPPIRAEPDNNMGIKKPFNVAVDGTPKSLDSQVIQKLNRDSNGDSGIMETLTEPIPIILNVSDTAVKTSVDITMNFENPKLFSEAKVDECISGLKDGEITSGKQPELALTDVAVKSNIALGKQPHDKKDIEEEKMGTKTRSPVGNNCESKLENQILQKHDDKNESISASHEKRSEKKIHHRNGTKDKRRRRSGSRDRHSRSRSLYRDSHHRSRSRGAKHGSRTRSRTPRDYYYHSKYRSRSRDRFYRYEGFSYDRRSYRRYWTPDAEDRYSYRRRHSSSRGRSSRHERSASRDITPTADKSSRSHSYYERSKSRTESPIVSRHSSGARSISQCKTTDSRNRSSSCRNSPEYDIPQIERESEKSPLQRTENLESIDSATNMHKSFHHSASPRREKNLVKGLEVRAEKLKKHKKTKERHRKRKKSHHRKKDKKKPSPAESELDEKCKASSVLLKEIDLDLNALRQLADEGTEETGANRKKESIDCKNERMKKKKEKKKKKERRNTSTEKNDVTKKASRETLEDGEIITGKDMSPKAREKVVNYGTSESEEEKNSTEGPKNPAEQLIENYNTKGVPPTIKLTANSKATENSTKFEEDAGIIRSSVLSFGFVDELLKVPANIANMSKFEKSVKSDYEPINPKRETKITVDLEDDGISSKLKDSTIDFNEITAREAEKLKAGNITEAMNKLKELRGYVTSKVTVSNSATETEVIKQFNRATGNDSTFVGHSLVNVPLPKGMQVAVDVTERVGQTATSKVRTQEACTSAKIDLMDRDVRRKKEMLKRKWEEDEEDELSRLRYEALRSKTRRLMNDLKAERRRLKRERLRATIAMRRARERSVGASVDEILLADTSDSSETDDSEDYSSSHKAIQLAG